MPCSRGRPGSPLPWTSRAGTRATTRRRAVPRYSAGERSTSRWSSARRRACPHRWPPGSPEARGMVVMRGGVDIHAHVAGSSVNHARRLLPEEHGADPMPAPRLDDGAVARSGTGGTLPSTFATGYRDAGLGYTTAMEAAVAPLAARHA